MLFLVTSPTNSLYFIVPSPMLYFIETTIIYIIVNTPTCKYVFYYAGITHIQLLPFNK